MGKRLSQARALRLEYRTALRNLAALTDEPTERIQADARARIDAIDKPPVLHEIALMDAAGRDDVALRMRLAASAVIGRYDAAVNAINRDRDAALASMREMPEVQAATQAVRAAKDALDNADLPREGKHKDTPAKPSGKPEPRPERVLSAAHAMAYGWRELHAFDVQALNPRGRWVTTETLEIPLKYPKRAQAFAQRKARELKARVKHTGRIGYVNIEGNRISRAQYKRILKGTGHVETCPKHNVQLGAGRWCGKCRRRWTGRALYGRAVQPDSRHVNTAIASIMARKPYT